MIQCFLLALHCCISDLSLYRLLEVICLPLAAKIHITYGGFGMKIQAPLALPWSIVDCFVLFSLVSPAIWSHPLPLIAEPPYLQISKYRCLVFWWAFCPCLLALPNAFPESPARWCMLTQCCHLSVPVHFRLSELSEILLAVSHTCQGFRMAHCTGNARLHFNEVLLSHFLLFSLPIAALPIDSSPLCLLLLPFLSISNRHIVRCYVANALSHLWVSVNCL